MEQYEVKGLVVRESPQGDNDKLLTLVTEELGRVVVIGKGVKSLKSKHMPATQCFSYSSFIIRKTNKYFYIADSEPIESFFGLRSDINKLALASYICDIANDLSLEGTPDVDLLRLTLNTLYAVSNKPAETMPKIKAAYEFRSACIAGFSPDLSGCCMCAKKTANPMYLDVMNGRLICQDCKYTVSHSEESYDGTAMIYLKLSPSVLDAMRFLSNAPISKYLSFNIDKTELPLFSTATEKYLINHLEHGFYTLEFYKSLI